MAADVGKFAAAIDKVYKTFSTQEVQIDQQEMSGLGERGSMQYVERKFQQQLQRARGAFLHEFRNHSVVVENEVRKIRVELTEKLEEKYGEKIALLREQVAEASVLVQRHREEILHLKSLATAQESYLTAVRHHWGNEQKEKLRLEIQTLKDDLDRMTRENSDLASQLLSRDELVAQLQGELSALEGELKRQASGFVEEKRGYDERIRGLRLEMNKQQDHFKEHLKQYEEKFAEYRNRTTAEIQIQDILNNRRSEALASMEEERQRHIKARTKPSARIGPAGEADAEAEAEAAAEHYEPYTMAPGSYRVDDMGMDTSWRDYQLGNLQLVPTGRKQPPPKFRVERACKAASLGPHAPKPTDTPRLPACPMLPANLAETTR